MSRSSRIRDSDYSRDNRRSRVSSEMSSLASRVFIGNLNTKNFAHRDIYDWMNKYGKVIDVAFFERHVLVQFDRENDARRAIDREKGQSYRGSRGDIRFASTSDGVMDSRSDVPRSRSPSFRQLPYERDSRDMSPYRESGRERSADRDRYYKAHSDDSRKNVNESEAMNNRHNSPEYRKYERSRNSIEDNRSRSNTRPEYSNPIPTKDVQEPRWNSPPFTDKIATDRPGFDAAIIVMSSELLNYAETIESRLQRQIALTTHIIVLKEESHANACVEDLNNKGVLYAFLVNGQNEKHFSCTLRILYGSPQEHRNMPLNNALSYVSRNFECYQKRVRDLKTIAPKPTFDPSRMPPGFIAPDDKIIYYLHLLADSRMLTIEELNEVIDFVQKRIQALANAEETMEKTPIPGMPVESIQKNSLPPKSNMPGNQPIRDEKVIQHQTQLHSKILNILKPVPHQSIGDNQEIGNMEQFNTYDSNVPSSKNNMVMNPKVQQALDTLMQSQFRPSVVNDSGPSIIGEESSRNFPQSNNNSNTNTNSNINNNNPNNPMANAYSMNPNMRVANPHSAPQRPMAPQPPVGQTFGNNNFHGYYQQQLGQPIFRGRPPFPARPQYPGY